MNLRRMQGLIEPAQGERLAEPSHAYYSVSVVADELPVEGWTPEPLVGSLWTAHR